MNVLKLIGPVFSVLQKGSSLANPSAWKNVQLVSNVLIAIVALLGAFGYKLAVTDDTLTQVAAVIAALANAWITVASSDKVGLPTPSDSGTPTDNFTGFGDK